MSEICTDSSKENAEGSMYDLHSIVIHAGTFGSGHYYAYVRPNMQKNRWYRYDDDRVTPVTFKEVKEDAFGGQSRRVAKDLRNAGFWRRILNSGQGRGFGWGGRNSSAYMLQYIKRIDIPLLFNET